MTIQINDELIKKFSDQIKTMSENSDEEQELKRFIIEGCNSLIDYTRGKKLTFDEAEAAVVFGCGFELAFTELVNSIVNEYPDLNEDVQFLRSWQKGDGE